MYYCKYYNKCSYRTKTSYCKWDEPVNILLKEEIIKNSICSKTKKDVTPELTEFELLMQRTIENENENDTKNYHKG